VGTRVSGYLCDVGLRMTVVVTVPNEWGGSMELQVNTYVEAGHTVLEVFGEVDVHTAPALRDRMADGVDSGPHDLVVDLSGVDFLDSTGLGVLVGGLTRARAAGGDLSLVCSRIPLLRLLEITGLDEVFVIHATAAAAVAAPPAA
jgi:anti-sigma B factor antagonist